LPDQKILGAQFMSWDQVREVSANGIAIGSHSMNHPVLAQLSDEEQRWELRESKSLIEEKISQPVRSLAYPVGGEGSFTGKTREIAANAGYELGFSFLQGAYSAEISDRFQIHRIQLDRQAAMYKAQSTLPRFFLKRQEGTKISAV